MDENLFYKGVDKKAVHGARLSQSHHVAQIEEADETAEDGERGTDQDPDCSNPPYPFDTANTLLALTRKHNVSFSTNSSKVVLIVYLADDCPNRS